jgi:hypothetical protein
MTDREMIEDWLKDNEPKTEFIYELNEEDIVEVRDSRKRVLFRCKLKDLEQNCRDIEHRQAFIPLKISLESRKKYGGDTGTIPKSQMHFKPYIGFQCSKVY